MQLSKKIGYPANHKTITLLQDAVLEIEKLIKDKHRIDWLADIENTIGNVQLPTECVELHIDDLRAAIDAAMVLHRNMMIDTGDIVKHIPTGEKWVVACVIGNKLSWVGYPEGQSNLSDCELLESADENERKKLLTEMANSLSNDHRTIYAKNRLKSL